VDTHFNSHFASLAPQNMVLLAREQLRLLSSQRLALPLADFERQDAGGSSEVTSTPRQFTSAHVAAF
jgi:hypothetical protein